MTEPSPIAPAPGDIARAAEIIRAGRLVAMPTETVYGLAGDALSDAAVAKIYEVKARPQFNPLIAHVSGPAMAGRFAALTPLAEALMAAFWPGPLTLVLPRRADSGLSNILTAGLDTVALRAPDNAHAQALIAETDRPLAAPSANPSGAVSPTLPDHVRAGLGESVDFILDGGPCRIGVESTIIQIDGTDAILLRPGGLARADIERVVGAPLKLPQAGAAPAAPGMLKSHYAPGVALRLNRRKAEPGEAFLGFGSTDDFNAVISANLSQSGDVREAAANLFTCLRSLDMACAKAGVETLAVAPVPDEGLGEAINDRLQRAAAPRQ